MNCKQGELAIYLGKHATARGMVVVVGRPATANEVDNAALPAWHISPPLPKMDGSFAKVASDVALRPIRDQDGQDESLSWAKKPSEVAA